MGMVETQKSVGSTELEDYRRFLARAWEKIDLAMETSSHYNTRHAISTAIKDAIEFGKQYRTEEAEPKTTNVREKHLFVEALLNKSTVRGGYEANLSRSELRDVINEAILFGISLRKPSFPPDSQRIRELEEEKKVLEMALVGAARVVAKKDGEIKQLSEEKPTNGGKDAEIQRLRARLEEQHNELTGVIVRQKDKITALQSNPENEEARFNIERQYEREFTNVAYLNEQLFTLRQDNAILKSKNTRLEEMNRTLQERLDARKREEIDIEEGIRLFRQAASRLG